MHLPFHIGLDKPDEGQYVYGIVSWPVTDGYISREIYVGFHRWCFAIYIKQRRTEK